MRNEEVGNFSYTGNLNAASVKAGIPYLLIGGGIGAAVALLLAPKAGTELRGDIADVTKRSVDATKEKANGLRTQSSEAIGSLRSKADGILNYAANRRARAQEALDLATFENAMIEENVIPLAEKAARTNNRKSSSIM
jgi:gas vesicle protein